MYSSIDSAEGVAILYITKVKKKLSNHLHHNHAKANARIRRAENGQIYKRLCAGLFSLFFLAAGLIQ
jgi:hypothetical protein